MINAAVRNASQNAKYKSQNARWLGAGGAFFRLSDLTFVFCILTYAPPANGVSFGWEKKATQPALDTGTIEDACSTKPQRDAAIECAARGVKCSGLSHNFDRSLCMATIERLLTAEEYAQLPDNGAPTELVRGRIVEMNVPNSRHGWLCVRVAKILAIYVDDHELGRVLGNDSGMITERDPDTVRGPDISFFSYARIPKGASLDGYAQVAPEVAVEVRSPRDRWPKLLRRVSEFLNAGVLAVYVVDAQKETITLFDADSDPPGRTFQGDDELTFPEPISGLRVTVRQIFS